MKEILKKKLNKKGFTLAELLIVVAIIAVLVAIAVPVFGGQLQKAKHATDLANVRAVYVEKVATAMMEGEYDSNGKITVALADLSSVTDTSNGGNGSTVTSDGGKITVKLGSNEDGFEIDDDVTITTGG